MRAAITYNKLYVLAQATTVRIKGHKGTNKGKLTGAKRA
jgi:hypothetical protein